MVDSEFERKKNSVGYPKIYPSITSTYSLVKLLMSRNEVEDKYSYPIFAPADIQISSY